MKRNISETSKGGDLVWGRGWKKRSSTEKSNEFCPFCFSSRLFCSLGRFDWHNVFCSTLQNIVADNRYSCFLHSSLCSAQFVNLCNFEIRFPFRISYAMDADWCYINKLENVLKGIKTVLKHRPYYQVQLSMQKCIWGRDSVAVIRIIEVTALWVP